MRISLIANDLICALNNVYRFLRVELLAYTEIDLLVMTHGQ
jgi:hypothetical protein